MERNSVLKINDVKMPVLNLIYKFNTILTKFSARYFVDIYKLILKTIQKSKGFHTANTIPRRTKLENSQSYY